jgi:hypothetical protein
MNGTHNQPAPARACRSRHLHRHDAARSGQAHFDLEMAKEAVGKQAARINPHLHGADGTLQPV